MENNKYSNICKNYEKILKKDCNDNKYFNEFYCNIIADLLKNCTEFKKLKIKKELKESLKFDQSLK